MKTRAILQTSPFKTRDGEWVAIVQPEGSSEWPRCAMRAEHKDLRMGDTITVERHGSEWRAI